MCSGGDRLQILKNKAESIKCKLVDNLVKNINDQNEAGTLFEYTSAFDLHRKIDLEERCALLVNLAEMYCKDYTHSVVAREDDDAFWVEYNISLKYPAKISRSVDEILSEFKNLYPICNRKWGNYSKDLKEGNFRFWKYTLSFYSTFTQTFANWSKLWSVLQVTQGLWKDHTPDLQSCATKIATS